MSQALNPRHEAFCQAYVRGPHRGNASASYAAAGYRPSTANAARLAHQPDIRRRIEELMHEDAEAHRAAVQMRELGRAHVLTAMKQIGFANVGGFPGDLSRLEHDRDEIRNVQIEFFPTRAGEPPRVKKARLQLADKRAALADLARCLGMFTSGARKNEHSRK